MEQQKLPNVIIVIVLAIISYLCCCIYGVPAIILSGIGLLLVRGDERKYRENPEGYSNYSQLKTAKIMAIIGLVLGVLYLAWTIYQIQAMGGWDAMMEQSREIMEQWGIEE